MKKLQNGFTTPKQSKRLLELGVPTDSADCALLLNKEANQYDYIVINNQDDYNFMDENTIPCWSVGRLIEILHITYKQDWREYLYLCTTETCNKGLINQIMQYLEKYHKDHDFSKLGE